MKTSIIAMSVVALLAFGAASAATAPAASPAASPKADTAQQSKMGTCAKANKGKKGDDYKNAMSACLKGSAKAPAAAAPVNKPMPATTPATATRGGTAQQSKMASCSAANKGKTGDDYKSAMSACLKASPAASGK
ncbi:MAG TPA: PsiF family protein [Xanthomonadaceae bacterium]|jgi:hypothetical protein|nr:PsiF family protein [Xanthomonadaceae bacterium]